MKAQELQKIAQAFVDESPLNRVWLEKGKKEIRLFEAPLMGYAWAEDALFDEFQKPGVIGSHFRKPREWLENASTVISFFLPFTEAVRQSNRTQQKMPSEGWLYGRVEGQHFVNALCETLRSSLCEQGWQAVVPTSSELFYTVSEPAENGLSFTSNWSERHVAFACGLGTFGLSKGLITAKGMAGRFGSLVTNWETSPSPRPYTQVYEYCTLCGKCAARCPGAAISLEKGKDHHLCLAYQQTFLSQTLPRFGCGLCQTAVPCECGLPVREGKE